MDTDKDKVIPEATSETPNNPEAWTNADFPTQPASEDEVSQMAEAPDLDLREPITWDAPEGARVQRGIAWYVLFGLVLLALMVLAIVVFKSWTFAILLPIMAVALLMFSDKNPRIINYAISPKGVYVADKLHDFSEFRSFGLVNYSGQYSIVLLPVKRFSPGLTIYFSEEDGERIVDMLGARLPMQEIKPDALEKLIRIIKL